MKNSNLAIKIKLSCSFGANVLRSNYMNFSNENESNGFSFRGRFYIGATNKLYFFPLHFAHAIPASNIFDEN